MYSKAGRATTEIFTVLQHGEEILQPKVKFFKAQSSSLVQTDDKLTNLVAKRFGQNNLLKDLAGIVESTSEADAKKKIESKTPKVMTKVDEPFSKVLSRESRDKVLTHKKVSSNAAYYTPKYEHIEKRNVIMVDYSKSPTKRLFDDIVYSQKSQSATLNETLSLPAIPNKPTYRVQGPISLANQCARPDVIEDMKKRKVCLTDTLPDPELPAILSSVPRLPRIKFSRSIPRKDLIISTAADHCPTYSPNYEYAKKNLGKIGIELSKITGRKDVVKKSYYTYETVYDYDEYVSNNNSQVYPKVKYPVFDKMAPRDRQIISKYSSFAVNNDTSKVSHEHDGQSPKKSLNNLPTKSHVRSILGQQSFDNSVVSSAINLRTL